MENSFNFFFFFETVPYPYFGLEGILVVTTWSFWDFSSDVAIKELQKDILFINKVQYMKVSNTHKGNEIIKQF